MTSAPELVPAARRPSFGEALADRVVTARWTALDGWSPARLESRACLPADAAMSGLHHGQVVFEGLKALRQDDGGIALFRPADHAQRLARSAGRLSLPEVPSRLFLQAVDDLAAADGAALPADPGLSFYLRPVLCGTEPCLAVRPARECLFFVTGFVTGGLYAAVPEAAAIWVARDFCRAVPGGTGDVKCAGNYAPTYLAQRQAEEAGCQQALWLDPVERCWVEEIGTMNVFFVRGRQLLTPRKTGTLLPGITRDSLLTLAGPLGFEPAEVRISLDQLTAELERQTIRECFGSGTAAGVMPIGKIRDGQQEWAVGDGRPGPVTLALRRALLDVQHGRVPGPAGWLHRLVSSADPISVRKARL